ncbi:hypothetical protein VE23_07930 [Paenibacillus sp. D9]|uniref:TetR/AcrR family transcriptional regulator n=1 Tax=Paenibacillus sp. D9 TaxID=665792 RepID=UPI00061FE187|nr:TetR/AcrR family transcriptional regulator [Paenibacillus sp. D9]KKC47091.1 hypothetical protein VE23_07930 [Paenibacillus sp. D9]
MDKQLDRRAKRTREALQSALIRIIRRKGYEAATILEIAEEADYNRGTFYNHYAGKEELLEEIRLDFLQQFADLILGPYPGMSGVGAADIYPSSLLLFQHVEQNKETFLALLAVDRGLGEDMNRVLKDAMKRDLELSVEEQDPEVDREFMYSYLSSATIGVVMYWAGTGFKFSSDYMARQLLLQINNRLDYIEFKRTQ